MQPSGAECAFYPNYDARALAQQVFPLAVGAPRVLFPKGGASERRKRTSHALCARLADELQRRRGTHIGEHLKMVLIIIDGQER